MKHLLPVTAGVLTAFVVAGCSSEVSFQKDIKPILDSSCVSCHDGSGEGVTKSAFSARDYDSVMKGTKFGPVIVAGDSASSTLYRLISHQADQAVQMPPHHAQSLAEGRLQPLSKEQIELFRLWIDQGARNN